jgi:hypothetical protein
VRLSPLGKRIGAAGLVSSRKARAGRVFRVSIDGLRGRGGKMLPGRDVSGAKKWRKGAKSRGVHVRETAPGAAFYCGLDRALCGDSRPESGLESG